MPFRGLPEQNREGKEKLAEVREAKQEKQTQLIARITNTKIPLWMFLDGKIEKVTDDMFEETISIADRKFYDNKRTGVTNHVRTITKQLKRVEGAVYVSALNKKNAVRKFKQFGYVERDS